MMGSVYWEFPPSGDIFAIGWAFGECRYEISSVRRPGREATVTDYTLWTMQPDGEHKLRPVSLGKSPFPLQLIRAAETIADQELVDSVSTEIDRTDDADWSN